MLTLLAITITAAIDPVEIKSSNGECLEEFSDRASLSACDDNDYQKWVYRPATKALMNYGSHKCLDVKDDWDWDGQPIIMYQCTGMRNQQFEFNEVYGTINYIGNGKNDNGDYTKCLDVHLDDYNVKENRARIELWGCHNRPNQQFTLPEITDETDPNNNFGCTLDDYIRNSKICTGRDVQIQNPYTSPDDDWERWTADILTSVVSIITTGVDTFATVAGGPTAVRPASFVGDIINLIIGLTTNSISQDKENVNADPNKVAFDKFSSQILGILHDETERLKNCMDEKIAEEFALDKLQTIAAFADSLTTIYKYHSTDVEDLLEELKVLVRNMDFFVAEKFDTFSYTTPGKYSANLPAYKQFVTIYESVVIKYIEFLYIVIEVNKKIGDDIDIPSLDTTVNKVYDDIQILKIWINGARDAISEEYLSIKALSAGDRACLSGSCNSWYNDCDQQLHKEYRFTAFNNQQHSVKQFGFWPSDNAAYKYNFGIATADKNDMDWDYLTQMTLDMSGTVQMQCKLREDMWGYYQCNTYIRTKTVGTTPFDIETISDGCCINLNYQAKYVLDAYKAQANQWRQDFAVEYINGIYNFESKILHIQADISST